MDATNNIATDLFYKVRSRFSGLKLGSETGEITINPEEARFFDFDYTEGENAIGHVSVSLAEPNSMKVYFSTGITEGMDDNQKDNWYKFLKELRQFAKRRLLAFDTRDIAKDNLDKRDYEFLSQYATPKQDTEDTIVKPVGENIMSESNMYGTKTQSFQKLLDTRLIIKHSKKLTDDQVAQPGARTRNISALFVENQEGERFKYPFIHLAGARAMQRHIANGGVPYDEVGSSIINMSEEIAQLRSFGSYVVNNDLMNSETNSLVERSKGQLDHLREQIKKLAKQKHYEAYVEQFQGMSALEVPQEVVEELTQKFTVKNFKEEISSVFPVLYRLMKENELGYNDIVEMINNSDLVCKDCGDSMGKPTTDCPNDCHDPNGDHWMNKSNMKEADNTQDNDPFAQFEQWAMRLGEESAIQSMDDDEKSTAVRQLQQLVDEHFPAGVDGTNAIQSLEGIIDDPRLEQQIKQVAKEDPDQCVRPLILSWLEDNAPDVIDELDFGDMVDGSEDDGQPDFDQEYDDDPMDDMMDDVGNELGKIRNLAGVEEDSKFDRNFEKRIAAKAKGGKSDEYMSKKADQARQQNKDLDPAAAEKGLGIGVLDREKAYAKAKKKGAKFPSRGVTTSPNTRDPKRLPEQEKSKDLPFEPDENPTDKDEFGNIIKKKNLPKHLAKKGRQQAMDLREVAEFIMSFYDRDSKTFPKGPEAVATIVGKKFGESAQQAAQGMLERMAPQQAQGADELEELARMRQLSGM